jgi:hypothetical protein
MAGADPAYAQRFINLIVPDMQGSTLYKQKDIDGRYAATSRNHLETFDFIFMIDKS